MNRIIIWGVALVYAPLFAAGRGTLWPHYDFNESMKCAQFEYVISSTANDQDIGYSGAYILSSMKELYERLRSDTLPISDTPKIPKIIHQIWIGKEVPQAFRTFQLSWQILHPDWQYRLWTQDDIDSLHMVNEKYIYESHNPGEQSDLMRYEILYKYGGVYVDFDFECLRPLDILHHTCDMYVGIQPLDSDYVQIGIGIIGSCPGHPVLKHCIETIKDDWHKTAGIVAHTGPLHFTRSFLAEAGKHGTIDIPFPAMYFHPLGSKENERNEKAWLDAGAFAVHHWAKTWLGPRFRRPQFKNIKNY